MPLNDTTSDTDTDSTSSNSSHDSGIYGSEIYLDPDLLSYHVMLDQWKLQDENSSYAPTSQLWKFRKILKHRKQGPSDEVLVNWTVGSPKWETMSYMKHIDLIALVDYAKRHCLSNRKGWKWVKLVDQTSKKIISRLPSSIFAAKRQTKTQKMHFGHPIPTSLKDAYYLDNMNNNTLWADLVQKELDELLLYDSFKVLP